MTCPTCEEPRPQNDDRFWPYCSQECQLAVNVYFDGEPYDLLFGARVE